MNKENIIKTLNNEKLNGDELAELLWLLNKDQYKERPVTIEEFYSSKEFVAEKWPNIFPLWKQTLKELFPTPFNAPYNEVLISAAAGSGKTVTATISILYDLYKLGCLKDPCSFYGLTPGTMIIMAIFSATASTAAVNWNDITTGIEACPWMMCRLRDKKGLAKKNGSITPVEILKGLYIQTGSKFQHSMGKAIFDGLMDEAAFGGSNSKDAQKSYAELSSRIKTRFTNWGNKGNIPGHLFLISSPKEAGDFMQERIEVAKKSGSTLTKVMQNIATWDADPRKDSDDKFTVFIGNEHKEPCMYEPDAEVPVEEMDYLIYPPMRYYDEFKKDLLISIMNYGGITTTSDMALFKSPTVLNEVFMLNNPFNMDVVELPFNKMDKQLMDFCDLTYFKDIRHPDCNRFIHIDAAYSTNTLDVYGLAAGYCTLTNNVQLTNIQEDHTETDVFTKRDRQYFIDFAVGITAPKGQEVSLTKVQDFIEYLIKDCRYPVASISADQFQSKQTLQNLQTKGFKTDYISVDRSRDPYLFLRYLIHNKQIAIAKNEYLKQELRKLRDDGKKIDHPVNCLVADTQICLVDGRTVTIKDLLYEQQYKQNWVYTFNEQTQKIEPKRIKHVFQSGITKQLVKVTLDNGEQIICTPNHPFMLRDGSYEQIQNLTPDTSLMPLYTKISEKGLKGYRLYYEPMEDCWHYEHRAFGNPNKTHNVIHHCNYNKLDNCPSNLKEVTASQHRTIHNNSTMDYTKTALSLHNYHLTQKDSLQYLNRNKKISQKLKKHNINKPISQRQLKIHNNEKVIQEIQEYYNIDYYKLDTSQKLSYMSKYYRIKNPEYTKKQNELISKAHKEGKYKNIQNTITQKRWITNGIQNKFVFKNDPIPEGFRPGRTISEETKQKLKSLNSHQHWTEERKQEYSKLQSELTSNRIWITNGIEDKYIIKDSIIPEGFTRGRCKVGKNHKIVSIEYITKPCKVYDLEIEDNHNFALATGVFVHNSHKDLGDAVAGSIWNCANSTEIMSASRIAQKVLTPVTYNPVQSQSYELMEFERLKQQYATGIFKGL